MLLGKGVIIEPTVNKRKAAFFDRDGVINVDHGYVHRTEQFEFVPEAVDLLLYVQSQGYEIIVVTNQSGIARGLYTENDLHTFNDWMCEKLIEVGVLVTQIYFCPHHPTAGDTALTKDCLCRKPKPEMILQAADDHGYNLSKSIMIGDKYSDMQCAVNAKLRAGYWLTDSARTRESFKELSIQSHKTSIFQVNSLGECIHLI